MTTIASWRLAMNALKARVVDATAALTEPHTAIIGWPSRNQLAKGLQDGRTFISVYKPAGLERRITGFIPVWCVVPNPTPRDILLDGGNTNELTYRLTSSLSATFTVGSTSGTPVPNEVIAIVVKRYAANVPDLPSAHRVVAGDTPALIAQTLVDGLAAHAIPNLVATAVGATVTLTFSPPPAALRQVEDVAVRAAPVRVLMREVTRLHGVLWVNVWAPSPDLRDIFVGVLETDFATFPGSSAGDSRLVLSNGTSAYTLPAGGWPSDTEEAQKNWRYTLTLSTEYGIYETDTNGGTILDTLLTYTVLQPPGITGGPGGQLVNDSIASTDWVDPWVVSRLDALTIFAA